MVSNGENICEQQFTVEKSLVDGKKKENDQTAPSWQEDTQIMTHYN